MRVFLAEDQYLLRQGLERLLVSQGVEVVGSVATAEDFLAAIDLGLGEPGRAQPAGGVGASTAKSSMDLALLDIRMPPTNTDEGIRAALELRRRRRGFPVVLLSQYVEHVYLDELLGDGAGGIGYLLKDRCSTT